MVLLPYSSLFELFMSCVDRRSDVGGFGRIVSHSPCVMTFGELYGYVERLAAYLVSRGVKHGDRVAIIGNSCPEWVISDLAILGLGAVVVPIYPTLSRDEIAFILEDSGAVFVIGDAQEFTLSDVMACPACESFFWPKVGLDDLASIVYTSGTTGRPKGVMLSHGNFLSNVRDILETFPIRQDDVLLSILPLSHVFERTVGYYALLGVGATVIYSDGMEFVSENLLDVRPTVMISVPRLYEKVYDKILLQARGVKKWIFSWAILIGKSAVVFRKHLGRLPFLLRMQHRLADKWVFSKVREKMGGRLRFVVSGGAPLRPDLGVFFEAMGVLICEGYGMTETSPVVSANRLDRYKFGTVGLAFPSNELRIADDGELLVRGSNVMKGYWNLPDETDKVLEKDGWLHTGDIARIDEDGFVHIIDRKKELIVLSNGKKIAPQMVESALLTSPYISQVMVYGDKRSYLTALIVPNQDFLKEQSDVQQFYTNLLDDLQRHLAPFEKVKKFVLLAKAFSVENNELTISLKLKRKVICDHYQDELDALYTS
jgi:long-chain acyl-CoA synthetase